MTLRLAWLAAILMLTASAAEAAPSRLKHTPLSVAFYVPWDASGRASLAANIARLDAFVPAWVALRDPQGMITVEPDPGANAILKAAKRPPAMLPMVSNAHDDVWDTAAAESVILNPDVRAAFIARLKALAQKRAFAGFVFDFEALTPAATVGYGAFLAEARTALAADRREVWVAAPIGAADWLTPAFAQNVDSVVLMAYDECWSSATPGPVAGNDWLAAILPPRLAAAGPRSIVALGAYGYDWPAGGPGRPISIEAATALAEAKGAVVSRDLASGNETFAYDDAGVGHVVWFPDALTFTQQKAFALALHPRGVAVWRLGLEDPFLWWPAAERPAIPRATPGALPPVPCRLLAPTPPAPALTSP